MGSVSVVVRGTPGRARLVHHGRRKTPVIQRPPNLMGGQPNGQAATRQCLGDTQRWLVAVNGCRSGFFVRDSHSNLARIERGGTASLRSIEPELGLPTRAPHGVGLRAHRPLAGGDRRVAPALEVLDKALARD